LGQLSRAKEASQLFNVAHSEHARATTNATMPPRLVDALDDLDDVAIRELQLARIHSLFVRTTSPHITSQTHSLRNPISLCTYPRTAHASPPDAAGAPLRSRCRRRAAKRAVATSTRSTCWQYCCCCWRCWRCWHYHWPIRTTSWDTSHCHTRHLVDACAARVC
jgi:hypothetical protein